MRIALINAWAELGAFVAPWMMGLMKDATGRYAYGLLTLSATVFAGACIVFGFRHQHELEDALLAYPAA